MAGHCTKAWAIGLGFALSTAAAHPAAALRTELQAMPALSAVSSTATGVAVVDEAGGAVSVEVDGLSPPPDGGRYAVLLVDNAPGRSVAVEAGDVVLEVGALEPHDGRWALVASVDPASLAAMTVDLVMVTEEQAGAPPALVIGGFVALADKPGPAPDVSWGSRLFHQETFQGNGRTCGTCHAAANRFTLGRGVVAARPADDPLFVAEQNPLLRDLEKTDCLHGQARVLENVFGLDRPPVAQGTPHVFNVALSAPYGQSGAVPTLQAFSLGAIVQHAPRRLARVPGVDFRLPTQEELDAMAAYQASVLVPQDGDYDLDRLLPSPDPALEAARRSGKDLFFGAAKCGLCHNGPALDGGSVMLDTGIVDANPSLAATECPEPHVVPGSPLRRRFQVPSLFGIARTAPFFHNGALASLNTAIATYDAAAFNASPAGQAIGGIRFEAGTALALQRFLEALTPCGDQVADFGEACDDGNDAVGDGCRPDCTRERCGDGIVDPGEACDHGSANGADACCTATCAVVDGDGDGVCDAEECPHLETAGTAMTGHASVALRYPGGQGDGDDVVRIDGVTFAGAGAFDPTGTDGLHLRLENARTHQTLFATTLPAGGLWSWRAARREWRYRDRRRPTVAAVRLADLQEIGPGTFRLRLLGTDATLVGQRPAIFDDSIRLVVEIGDVCADATTRPCTGGTQNDRCRS